ncbi:MAG: type II toxin-antitoxin system RelE/ParE family toxin [Actinomycetota bacterium]|nr:type II toxin-antitoxin system RelE/ParE family toxin [Actinomycetota bacterium]
MNVVDKLAALGLRLGYPHSSSVEGETGEGLRELRPRAGNSAFRPIYRRFGGYWVILAIAHKATYDRAVADAQARAAAYPR